MIVFNKYTTAYNKIITTQEQLVLDYINTVATSERIQREMNHAYIALNFSEYAKNTQNLHQILINLVKTRYSRTTRAWGHLGRDKTAPWSTWDTFQVSVPSVPFCHCA